MKDMWRFTVMNSGGQYVMLVLIQVMPLLCADNWDMIIIVTTIIYLCKYVF